MEIRTEEWDEYFKVILEGSEGSVKLELGNQERGKIVGKRGEREEKEEEVNWKKIKKVIKKLKKRKAAGEDELQNEVWLWEEEG